MATQRSLKQQLGVRLLGPLPAAAAAVDFRCTRGVLGAIFGSDISGSIYTCDFPQVPPYGSSVRLKKTDKGRGVSIYVTTRRNPLVCTGRTAGKSPPTDTQGDHEVIMR